MVKSGKKIPNVNYSITNLADGKSIKSGITDDGEISIKLLKGKYRVYLAKKYYRDNTFDLTIPVDQNDNIDNFKLKKKGLIKRIVEAISGKH